MSSFEGKPLPECGPEPDSPADVGAGHVKSRSARSDRQSGGADDGTDGGSVFGAVGRLDRERSDARMGGVEEDAVTGAFAISAAGITAAAPAVASRDAMAEFFRLYHRRVLVVAYRITGSMADAEDVAQAVFLRLMSADASVPENVGSYLYRAAANGALDVLRRRKSAGKEELEDGEGLGMRLVSPGASPEAEALGRELGMMLRVAIAELPARAAEMFALRYLEDLGNGEIGRLMDTSQAVVAVTLHQARAKLKKRLRELEGVRR